MKNKLFIASLLTVFISASGYAEKTKIKNPPPTFKSTQSQINKKNLNEKQRPNQQSYSNNQPAISSTARPSTSNNQQIAIYTMNRCPYCDKVADYLAKINKSIPFKNVSTNSQYHDELLKYGGKPQVPCLIVDGKAIYESDAIIQWIANNKNRLN